MNFSLNVTSQCLRQAVSCFINHNSLCFVSKHLKIDIFIFIDVQSCCDTFKHSSDIFSRVELRFAWTSRLDASQRRLSIWVNPVKYIHKIQDCLTILIHFLFTFNYFIFWFRLIYFSLRNFSHSFLLFICEPVFLSMIYDKYFFFSCPVFSASITQWNLIFYGTDDPPQKSDPPRLGKKKTVNDVVHNSLENSQWGFITQDVSVSPIFVDYIRSQFTNESGRGQWWIIIMKATHLSTIFLSFHAGDRCRCSFRCSANCWWRPNDQLLMS